MLSYEKFEEAWNDLERGDKIALFNEYACEYCPDDQIYNFDEEFFDVFFSGDPMDAARATHFGDISSWSDEYIRLNGYGNLVSMSDYKAAEWADEYTKEIYEHEELWSSYIDEDDYNEDELKEEDDGNKVIADTIHYAFEEVLDTTAVDQYVEDYWRGDISEKENIQEFKTWYEDTFNEKITLVNEKRYD